MTQIRCKSFKSRDDLDGVINQFLTENNVSSIEHVSSYQSQNSILSYVTIFYREAEEKKVKPRASKVKPVAKPQPIENKEVSNG